MTDILEKIRKLRDEFEGCGANACLNANGAREICDILEALAGGSDTKRKPNETSILHTVQFICGTYREPEVIEHKVYDLVDVYVNGRRMVPFSESREAHELVMSFIRDTEAANNSIESIDIQIKAFGRMREYYERHKNS